jgi:hypothetical protein
MLGPRIPFNSAYFFPALIGRHRLHLRQVTVQVPQNTGVQFGISLASHKIEPYCLDRDTSLEIQPCPLRHFSSIASLSIGPQT